MAQVNQDQANKQVLVVSRDSESSFSDLFNVIQQKDNPRSLPLSQRKLPESFFKPPMPRSNHSRESSADSTNYGAGPLPPQNHLGLVSSHSRSRSSPAQLNHRNLVQAPTPVHMKTPSADFLEDMQLPPGWEMAKTADGQRYYLNHIQQITTWEDPRKSLSATSLTQQQTLSPQQQLSPAVSSQNLGALPAGWEQSTTPQGEVYFINHNTKKTSWFDPRFPEHLQRQGMKLPEIQKLVLNTNSNMAPPNNHSPNQPPPPAQQASPSIQQSMSPQQQASPGPRNSLRQQQQTTINEAQVRQQLLKLQQEREALRKRQEEIATQEMMLMQQDVLPVNQNSSVGGDMQGVNTSGVDPFLGQAGNNMENHARQNSADSGLGGMTSYSLPRTPEDFLSNVDEMDSQESGHKMQTQTDFNLDSMQGTMSMDSSDTPTGMDSDELVPSLQEDISNELLNDVDVQAGLLTWL